jgi:phosphoenolpyruvate synthase/pyruvate phosphate dikinase
MSIPIPTTATERVIQPVPIRTRTLHGKPASPGRYTGIVRVIHSEAEFDRLRAGEVLVCRVFLPVWTVLFPHVGALVTDSGGILSTRQSSPANAASPQSLLPAWAQLCCGTAN